MSFFRFVVGCSLALTLTACVESTPVCGGKGLCENQDPVVRTDAAVDSLQCEGLQERARELLGSYQHCEADEDCVPATITAGCLSPFLCTVSIARDANLGVLQREARALRAEVEACFGSGHGRSCAIARCAAPYTLQFSCDRSTQRCSARYDPTLERPDLPPPRNPMLDDAGGLLESDAAAGGQQSGGASADATLPTAPARDAATEDAGTHTDGSSKDSRFSCTKASDCAVKNVGNCCGYYPRCANVDANFAPPDCSGGQAGVCGWPEITSCDCRANTCVSLQNGQQI